MLTNISDLPDNVRTALTNIILVPSVIFPCSRLSSLLFGSFFESYNSQSGIDAKALAIWSQSSEAFDPGASGAE